MDSGKPLRELLESPRGEAMAAWTKAVAMETEIRGWSPSLLQDLIDLLWHLQSVPPNVIPSDGLVFVRTLLGMIAQKPNSN